MARKPEKLKREPPRDLSQLREAFTWTVDEAEAGERIDRFLLARLTWRSRNSIVQLLREDQVQRNGEPIRKKSARVQEGDLIAVRIPPPDEEERHEELGLALTQAILHDDEHMIALAKPAGMVMHPVGEKRVNTLIQALHWAYLHGPLHRSGRDPEHVPRICHRLDKDTSGVVVLAKTPAARTALQKAFDDHDLEKDYRGVVSGVVAGDSGTVDLPIGPDPEHRVALAMTTRPDGLPARTDWRVDERFGEATSLKVRIHTGRQHQIRVHLQSLGHPILLDPLYGDERRQWPEAEPVIDRQALHAERIALAHPVTGTPLQLLAPLPADLEGLLRGLRGVNEHEHPRRG